jgi:hypothetical protein
MSVEQPFKISVTDDELALLQRKLDDARLPDEVNGAKWDYGVPLADIRRLASRLKDGYDWRTHERELNALPMFTRTIPVDGFGELNVHYVHQRSTVEGAIPVLFVHTVVRRLPFLPSETLTTRTGPGSFLEVTKILPLLTAASIDHPSFHVVAPSLPGYAWSEGVLEKGFQARHYAEVSLIWPRDFSPFVEELYLSNSALQQADALAGLLRIRDPRWRLGPCRKSPIYSQRLLRTPCIIVDSDDGF